MATVENNMKGQIWIENIVISGNKNKFSRNSYEFLRNMARKFIRGVK